MFCQLTGYLSKFFVAYTEFTFGLMTTFIPYIAASQVGATKIFRLLDHVSKNDLESTTEPEAPESGAVKLKHVDFELQRRPKISVLRKT